jgi:hypothetical protein
MVEKLMNLLKIQNEQLIEMNKNLNYLIKLNEDNILNTNERNHNVEKAKLNLKQQMEGFQNLIKNGGNKEDFEKILSETMNIIHL